MKLLFILCIYIFSGRETLCAPAEVTIQPNSIQNDLSEIVKMIPRDKIRQIALDHLENDDGFKAALQYMKSDEWTKIIEDLREKQEWIDFKHYLGNLGVPMDTLIICMQTFLQNASVPAFVEGTPKNLTNFFIDVQGVIPLVDIVNKLSEKLKSNPELSTLLEKLKSPDSKAIVEKALDLPEIHKIVQEFKEMGWNLYDLMSILYFFLGWGEFKMI